MKKHIHAWWLLLVSLCLFSGSGGNVVLAAPPSATASVRDENLVRNPGFEEDAKGYSFGDTEYAGATGKSEWEIVNGGRSGGKCLRVAKVEGNGGIFCVTPSLSSTGGAQDRVRRFMAVWWGKTEEGSPPSGVEPVLTNQRWDCKLRQSGVGKPTEQANGWFRSFAEWEVQRDQVVDYFRLQIHGAPGRVLLVDDLALYEVTEWKADEIERMKTSDPTPDTK